MSSYYIFVDTETTGLPNNWNAPLSDSDNWPRIVQIAWLVYDENGNELKSNNYLIKPNNFVIPENVIKIHGITNERANAEGSDLMAVLYEFNENLKHCECIVGHNISFDTNIIAAEFLRLGIETDTILGMTSHCTMKTNVDLCKIQGGFRGYKYPKLIELYKIVMGKELANAHDALVYIKAAAECFWAIKNDLKE